MINTLYLLHIYSMPIINIPIYHIRRYHKNYDELSQHNSESSSNNIKHDII
jgi:hypothetical protein